MNLRRFVVACLLVLIVPCPILSAPPQQSLYIAAESSRTALILCHGRGKHPSWRVVDPLRKAVASDLSWHSLSLQMPTSAQGWKEYALLFPEAFSSLLTAIDFLQREKKVEQIYLMGHSMGARMASAFVAQNPQAPIAGLVVAGCRNNGPDPLSCLANLQKVKIPVLDIYGSGERKDLKGARARADLKSARYTQVEIPDADHRFTGQEDRFVSAVERWLRVEVSK